MEKATLSHREVLEECAAFLTPERIARFRAAASERCFSVLPVVEGLHDVGNIAAVARSADALGFGRLHVIRQGHDKYKLSHRAISAGSDKWLHEQVCDVSSVGGCEAAPAAECNKHEHANENEHSARKTAHQTGMPRSRLQGTTQTLRSLKGMGYRVAVTHLREDAVDIRELDWAVPTAVVLGNEKDGTSDEVRAEREGLSQRDTDSSLGPMAV